MADPVELLPARFEFSATLNTEPFGNVKMIVRDRISVDDVTLHLIERELFRLAGGADPGADVNPIFIDALIKEGFIR